jgi:rhodanese-related sulfurtransferase
MKMNLTLSTLFFVLVATQVEAQQAKMLAATDFDKKMNTTKDKTVLDVRTRDEYNQGHLANAVLLDYYASDFKNSVSKLDKSKPVFVYCKGGGRSGSSCEILKDLGFKEVYDLQGGIIDWKKAGRLVVK